MKFQCKFDDSLVKFGAPRFIRCAPFDAVQYMQQFEIVGQTVNRDDQVSYLKSCTEEDGGWVAFVCGHPEQVRLFGFALMKVYATQTNKLDWHHVTGSQFNIYTDSKIDPPHKEMIVLDSLLTHPPMHPEGNRGYDPKRIGKIYDIVAKYRGQTSIVVLCPNITPHEAYLTSMVQADMMFLLKYRARELEL
jgi:hypothetical protein